jgi:hypothetical protein
VSDRKRTAICFVLVLIISIVSIFITQRPHLFDRYQVAKDVQNFYWMARYQEPDLFPRDRLRQMESLTEFNLLGYRLILYPQSLGYGLLFWVGSFFIDHIWLFKLMGFVLMPISVTYLFWLGKSIADEFVGAALSLLFVFIILASPRSIAITSGLQRGFTIPLLIVFTYYLYQRRYWPASAMVFISLLIYYPNFLLAALTYALSMIEFQPPFRFHLDLSRSRLVPLLLALTMCLGVIILAVIVEPPSLFLPKDVPVSQDPLRQDGGPGDLFISPGFGRAGLFDVGGDVVNFAVLATAACFIYALLGRAALRRLPAVFGWLLLAGVILYGVSFFVLWNFSSTVLYLPSRYTRSTLIWVILSFVGLNLPDFIGRLLRWLRRNVHLALFFFVSLVISLIMIILLYPSNFTKFAALGLFFGGLLVTLGLGGCVWIVRDAFRQDEGERRRGYLMALFLASTITIPIAGLYIDQVGLKRINPSRAERDVYRFLSTLPEDVMIAGDPSVMNGVPLFAERSVLVRELQPRDTPVMEFFTAYYAETTKEVMTFCRRYEVDYLVIDRNDFSPDYIAKRQFFYQPYNDAIVDLVAGRSDFVVPQLEPLFTSGSLAVVECGAPMRTISGRGYPAGLCGL